MAEKKYRVHDLVKFQYSEICEYSGENYTDRPLRNDEIVDLLNEQHETIQVLKVSDGEMEDYLARLEEENEQLKQQYHKVNNKLHSIDGVLEDLGSKKYISCDERLQALKKISKVMCE